MWTISEVKRRGKEAFQANYWFCVLVLFLLGLVSGLSVGLWVLLVLTKIFLINPFHVGCCAFFMKNAEDKSADLGAISAGFNHYWHNVSVMLLNDVYLFLWSLLFAIPGLVKSYAYRMVPYILLEHPELSANEVITSSREMMDGNKWETFVLDLSFIGWYLLGVITFGLVLVLWTTPYMSSTNAVLYLTLSSAGQKYRAVPPSPVNIQARTTPPRVSPPRVAVRGIAGPLQGQLYLVDRNGLVFGRQESCSIHFSPDIKGVSGLHCQVTIHGNTVMLTDLGSTYGTYLEPGIKLQLGTQYPIQPGARFYLGSRSVGFELIQI